MTDGDQAGDADGGRQRSLVTLVVRDYPHASPAFLDGLDEQAGVVESWWCDPALGERRFTACKTGPLTTRRDIDDAVHHVGLRTLQASDVVVLVVTGHGRRGTSARHLTLPDTDPGRLLATAYPTAELLAAALGSDAEHLLVIVNCCHAGALRGELDALLTDLPAARRQLATLAVFTTADFDELPRVVDLTELLRRVERRLRTPAAGYAHDHLSVDDLRRELAWAAAVDPDAPLLEPLLVWPPRLAAEPSPCIPNPGYQPPDDVVGPARRQAATSGAELDYWLDRASGRVCAADPGWYFAGRRALTTAVADFLRDGSGTLVVTGAAGTGKSAVIARAVTLSDPGFRDDPRYRDAVATAPRETVPPTGSIDVAVLARNSDAAEVAARIVAALGERPVLTAGEASLATARVGQLPAILAARRSRLTVVIDGLDEARNPGLLVLDLLGPLARVADERGRRLVRLVVGVRSPTPGSAGAGADRGLLDLVERAVASGDVSRLRTDGPDAAQDVTEYVASLLADPSSPYAGDPQARSTAAAAVAARVAPSFLDARLAGQRMREAPQRQDLDDRQWQRSLAEGTVGLLRADLAGVTEDDPGRDAAETFAVLRAAAFAPGAGIPWAEIWPAVTAAVLGRSVPTADEVIADVLSGRLSGYLTRDVEDGRIVYRPAHELLADALRHAPHRLLGQP